MLSLVLFVFVSCWTAAVSEAQASSKFRVVNGQEAVQHEFPSIVSLRVRGQHICGGTLLNARSVLTAAHCVHDLLQSRAAPSAMTVVAGEHSLQHKEGTERASPVAQIISHREYVHNAWTGDDIAILRLAESIQESGHIRYVTLPQSDVKQAQCQVVGWGARNAAGMDVAQVLQKAPLHIVPNEVCASNFPQTYGNRKQVCAVLGNTRTSACRGDSGGPLYCNGAQYGVVSFGRVPCAVPGVPAVFTRVPTYLGWIRQNM
jgi:trypsin